MNTLQKLTRIKVHYSHSEFFISADEELLEFLSSVPLGSRSKENQRIMTNYFNLPWPDGNSFYGYTEISRN